MRNLFLLVSVFVFGHDAMASSYIAIGNTNVKFNALSFDEQAQEKSSISEGSGFSAQFGHFLSNAMALEVNYVAVSAAKDNLDQISPVNYSAEISGDYTAILIGLRWFWYEFLNVSFGGVKVNYQPTIETTGALANYQVKEESQYTNFYGAGLGLTFKKMQFFYDSIYIANVNNQSEVSHTMGLRLFF